MAQTPLEIQPQGLSQVSSPRMPEGLSLVDDLQLHPDYVPARGVSDLTRWIDDPPGPDAAPAVPQPRPQGGGGGGIVAYRGVPEGADPMRPNEAGGRFFAPQRAEAERYGPQVVEQRFSPDDVADVGTLEDLRALVAGKPDMTVLELLELYRRMPDRKPVVSYTLPAELEGTPREFFQFLED